MRPNGGSKRHPLQGGPFAYCTICGKRFLLAACTLQTVPCLCFIHRLCFSWSFFFVFCHTFKGISICLRCDFWWRHQAGWEISLCSALGHKSQSSTCEQWADSVLTYKGPTENTKKFKWANLMGSILFSPPCWTIILRKTRWGRGSFSVQFSSVLSLRVENMIRFSPGLCAYSIFPLYCSQPFF